MSRRPARRVFHQRAIIADAPTERSRPGELDEGPMGLTLGQQAKCAGSWQNTTTHF